MKTITIHQPWASLIAEGLKTIETRTHQRFKTLKGQTIAIHAGLKFDNRRCTHPISAYYTRRNNIYGAIIATAFVDDIRLLSLDDSPKALIDCSGLNLYGLILSNIKKLDEPVFVKGRQGIWNYELK